MRGLWRRIAKLRSRVAAGGARAKEQMSPSEQRFFDEGVDDRRSEKFAEEHFGAFDPSRLLEGEEERP